MADVHSVNTERLGTYCDGTYPTVRIVGERNGFTYVTFLTGPNTGITSKVPSSWVVPMEGSDG